MKRYLIITTLLLAVALQVQAQTWAEWFKQNRTQRSYLVKQVAGLRLYISFARQGYDIATRGITTISALKNGDLGLHQLFFSGLQSAGPAISKYARIPESLASEVRIRRLIAATISKTSRNQVFPQDEAGYVRRVLEKLEQDCRLILEESLELLSEHSYQLSEDQRISRLAALRLQVEENLSFCRHFCGQVSRMASYRMNENKEVENSRKLNGIAPLP